ncbi:aromatic amino acid transport family protein [Legionella sp. CNM-1927-20]|uniref:aromatic amino acid transport family protein n=1 Tax=Legionella sp. CNM-1927-20 TaxID=3422221 RepID=UPI00403AE600
MLRFLSGTFLIIGAIIGGGILAIPIVSANYGFSTTLVFILASWLVMTKTGLYVLDLILSCPEKYNSYYSIVGKYLGDKMQLITVTLFLWLLYFSLSSYISGCTSLIMSHLTWSHPLLSHFNISLGCVIILGTIVIISAKIIIRLNVVLVSFKLCLLGIAIIFGSMYATSSVSTKIVGNPTGAFALLMVIVNAFGYQFIIPSLVSYYGRDNRNLFQWMLITSTTVVLLLYISWLYTIYTLIPSEGKHGLLSIYQSNNQLLAFNHSLKFYLHSTVMSQLLSTFQVVALFGSFICVSLGVFDFLVDVMKAKNRFWVGVATFTPPLILSLFSQNMYTYAMSASGYIAIILEIFIPYFAKRKYAYLNCNSLIE